MPEDDKRDGLRVGGWIPHYRDAAGPVDPPTVRATRPSSRRGGVSSGLPRAVGDTPSSRRTLALAGLAAGAAAVTLILALVDLNDPTPMTPPADRMVLPVLPLPSAPVSLLPSPSYASLPPIAGFPREPAVAGPPGGNNGNSPTPSGSASRPPGPPARTTPPAISALAINATIGLELYGQSGMRVTHEQFRAVVSRIGSGSSTRQKLDTRFVVRKGLANSECLSFESVGYPGYYLRHQNWILRLHRRDRTRLFDEDVTFCAKSTQGGAAFTLESLNYPGETLNAPNRPNDNGIYLTGSGASAFVARPPL
jgi:hypothetical protein